jgi:hypothetical protein
MALLFEAHPPGPGLKSSIERVTIGGRRSWCVQRSVKMQAKALLAEVVAVNETNDAEAPSSCKDRAVAAATGFALFVGLINLAAFSVFAYPRYAAYSGPRCWPKPLGTGKPEDAVWSGRRCWPQPDVFVQDADQQSARRDH